MSEDPDDRRREPRLVDLLAEMSSRDMPDTRIGRARGRALDLAERATTWGPLGPVAEFGWRVSARDRAVAGSVLAAAIAYRIFIWILPLVVLLVAGLGLYSQSVDDTSVQTLEDAGIRGYFTQSVGQAADSTGPLGHILIIISAGLVFLYQSYVLLRTLRAVTAFAWGLPVRPMPNPPVTTLLFLSATLGVVAAPGVIHVIVDNLGLLAALLAVPATLLVVPAYHLVVSAFFLPHDAPRWTGLIPGALVFGIGFALVEIVGGLLLVPWLLQKEDTYGVLGIAAGVLFLFFAFGRLIELAAATSAVMAEDRRAARASRGTVTA